MNVVFHQIRIIKILKSILFILFALLLSTCIKEEPSLENPQVSLNPGIALPTAHARYSLSTVFNTEETPDILQPNNEGILTVQYNEKVFSQSASEFITFDQAIEGSTDFSKKKGEKFEIKDTIEFDFSNSQASGINGVLYEVKFNFAQFNLSDEGYDLPLPTSIEIKFPSIYKPGTTDTAFLQHTVGEGSSSILEMSGYVAEFINNGKISNGLPIVFTYNSPITTKGFKLNYSFTLIDYEYIKGFFGNFQYNLGETSLDIDFLSEVDEIEIEFDTATFSIDFTNSFGITLDIYMDNLSATSIDGEDIPVSFLPTPDDPFTILPPDIIGDSASELKIYHLDSVLDLLASNPKNIAFEPVGEFNRPGSDTINFIHLDSKFALDIGLYIPLKFKASVIAFKDTFAFNGEELNNITQLEYLGLQFTSSNALPLDAVIDVHFLDENGGVLYELSDQTGESFKIGESVTEPLTQLIAIDQNAFEEIKKNKKIALGIALNTAGFIEGDLENSPYVEFKDGADYYIDITVKLIAEGQFILPPE